MGVNNTIKKEQIIPFEKLLNRGVQTDAFNQIEKSFFKTIYEQAFSLVRTVCNSSERVLKMSNQCRKSNRKLYLETHNVIAFTGRRGTGKTSAMLSIANYLCDKTVETIQNKTLEELREHNNFYNLGFVDTSMLNGNEDMFLILLSKIFEFLNDRFDDTFSECAYDKYSSLKEKICLIYDHYVSLKTDSGLNLNSSYNLMDRLSERFGVRNEFAKLVEETISLLNYTKEYSNKNGYLVICLDDIDMTLQEHVHVMQCIHQYFMIPNVIVMITTNFKILTASLKRDNFKRLELGYFKYDENNLEVGFDQTQDFLRKVIPSDMRITMPSWKKKDYGELFSRVVSLSEEYNSKDYANSFIRLQNSNIFEKKNYDFSPKQLIMFILAERTDIYLDAFGNKMHFMEPESLRSIYDMFYMLYGMNNLKMCYEENGKKSHLYRESRMANRKILLDYLNFKIVPGYDFTGEEQHFVRSLQEAPIERRGKIVWDYYYNQLTNSKVASRLKATYGAEYYENEKKRFSIENYSMGEVYRILHAGSRLGIMDKKLIKYILASLSFAMPQFIEKEKWKILKCSDQNNNKNDYKKTRDLFQYSLLGTWCLDIFNKHYIDIHIKETVLENMVIENNQEKFKKFFEDLIYLFLLSARSTKKAFDVSYDNGCFAINAHLDPTAFIVNSLRINERINNMKFELKWEANLLKKDIPNLETDITDASDVSVISMLEQIVHYICKRREEENDELIKQNIDLIKKNKKNIDDNKKIGENTDAINGIKSNLGDFKSQIEKSYGEALNNVKKDISEKGHNLTFMLKHIDISYNVIKRAVTNMIFRSDNNLKEVQKLKLEPYDIIKKFYSLIYEKLKEQDELYLVSDSIGINEGFSGNFSKHPVVKKISEGNFTNGCTIALGPNEEEVNIEEDSIIKEELLYSTISDYAVELLDADDFFNLANLCPDIFEMVIDKNIRGDIADAFLYYNNKTDSVQQLAKMLNSIFKNVPLKTTLSDLYTSLEENPE